MNWTEFSLLFGLGFLGSIHCAQMCGPIVVAYSLPLCQGCTKVPAVRSISAHLAYNSGRILTYTAIGALAGLIGSAMQLTSQIARVANVAAIVAGVLMLIAGAVLMGWIPESVLLGSKSLAVFGRVFRGTSRLIASSSVTSKFVLGLLLGFLPCGLVYAAVMKAVATGSSWNGAANMLAFGLGTAGALLAVGMSSSLFSSKLRRWGPQLAGVGVIVMGAILIWRGVGMHGMTTAAMHHHVHQ